MARWPKEKLLKHGSELSLEERIRRYQHNVKVIRASGCKVPTPAMVDSLDPAEIELWFADHAFASHRVKNAIDMLSDSADDGSENSLDL
ncbi:MAG: hypothetical protein R3D70_22490 [Rhizobiaceae bacterium]|jgi:hypothetical protein